MNLNLDNANLDNRLHCSKLKSTTSQANPIVGTSDKMVGVPGRSKACHTCRQRRIRVDIPFQCGSEKPSCKNCLKSGRSCAGYHRDHTFISSTYDNKSSKTGTLGIRQRGHEQQKYSLLQVENESMKQQIQLERYQGPSWISLPKWISTRNTIRDQFLALFIDRQIPSCILTQGQLGDHRKWLLRLPSVSPLSPALEDAILALSTASLEKNGDLDGRSGQSLKLYTRALYELQRAINNPQKRLDDQTLAACVLLGMFEFSECPGRTLRGPGQHIGGLGHDIFQVLRMHTVFQGLGQGRASQLAGSAWMEQPWLSKSKTMHDMLLDIFLQLPELLAKVREATSSPLLQDLSTSVKTVSLFLRLNDKLDEWLTLTDMEENIAHLAGDDRFVKDSNSMSFRNIQHKIQTSNIMTWPETSARSICQSVEYFFSTEFSGIGAGVVLSPLLVVKACLANSSKDASRELPWITEAIGRIQNHGSKLAGSL
ncbi:C6 zinc finger domain protein [Fusarium beomiforme]|uniref:C6 zinc finger domain protein n=1 Tax=Fusarium beomiforme TaxID=44412 RepID=A0A9P5AGN1_9HYPO|nr:C6 zinc finger domain protein [Fusarium beomiforme]